MLTTVQIRAALHSVLADLRESKDSGDYVCLALKDHCSHYFTNRSSYGGDDRYAQAGLALAAKGVFEEVQRYLREAARNAGNDRDTLDDDDMVAESVHEHLPHDGKHNERAREVRIGLVLHLLEVYA